jgi:RimJ/RimL family protein N-acetyltransferase
LRTFVPEDLPIYSAINSDPEVMRYLGGEPLSREETERQMAGASRSFTTSGYGKIAVERHSDGLLLGMCGLSIESWYPDELELGWRLGREHWGNGYATEAARAWLAYAFDVLGAPRVISIADVPNLRSIAVMRRIGMRFDHEAELPEPGGSFRAVIYSITAVEHRDVVTRLSA